MSEPAHVLNLPDDSGQVWPAQGSWTFDDYQRLPDDGRRYEVIRGFLYVTPAPTFDHQFVVSQLIRQIGNFVAEHGLSVVLGAPFDVCLPRGLGSPVQPDLLFLRREQQPQPGDAQFEGVPDLAVEVLSRSTRRRDRTVKLAAYGEAGIPEVWLVDPQGRTVDVFGREADGRLQLRERRGMGEAAGSAVLAGLRIEVDGLFPSRTL